MAAIPTKQMSKAVGSLEAKTKGRTCLYFKDSEWFGNTRQHKLFVDYDIYDNCRVYLYTHYDTKIVQIRKYDFKNKWDVKISSLAWSSTDRNNINGLLICLGVPRVRAYKTGDDVYLTIDGNKTKMKQIVIEED